MGFFDKLAFWKRKDEFSDLGKDLGLGNDFGKDMGLDSGPSPDLGMGLDAGNSQGQMQQFQKYPSFQQQNSFNVPQYTPPSSQPAYGGDYINAKNLEVISSKLDALKASLDSISQRLANLEAVARGEEEQRKRRYY